MTWDEFRTKWATEGRQCALRTLSVNDGKDKSFAAFVMVTSPDEAVYNFEARSTESVVAALNELLAGADTALVAILPPSV